MKLKANEFFRKLECRRKMIKWYF